jgi:glycerate 2-kinase
MHILIAPNAFKNSLSALEAAAAIAAGLHDSRFSGTLSMCPVGDGGDGTAELLQRHFKGRAVSARAHDPLGRPIQAQFALLDEHTAVIEMADASGLKRLRSDELDPLNSSSFGTGELIAHSLDQGVREILLCIGGSATVDGGTGLLRALGCSFRDAGGKELKQSPAALADLATVDLAGVDSRLADCKLTVLCDVANPLVGVRGAARVFGPQKGASPGALDTLERSLQRFSDVVFAQTGRDIAAVAHGGAAGGLAAGVFGLLDARLVTGIDYFLERINFDAALDPADLVITGEGSIDEQTLEGKGPCGVAVRAHAHRKSVVGFAGQVPLEPSAALRACFDVLIPIGHRAMTLAEAQHSTADNLRRTAWALGNVLALGNAQNDATALSSATIAPTK